MRVFIATFEHRHGSDVRVFRREESAEAWGIALAAEYWGESMVGVDRPADPADAAAAYWERMSEIGEEWFSVVAQEVEE